MNSLEGIIASNRNAEKLLARKAQEVADRKAALRKPVIRTPQPKRDKAGRLAYS